MQQEEPEHVPAVVQQDSRAAASGMMLGLSAEFSLATVELFGCFDGEREREREIHI